jgi:transcriptional regulator with XRE-family HTH domain
MRKSKDLRKILSQNIRNARGSLHISQAKLAESANISVSHIVDIEYCKTWVSDKTLNSIAKALNLEAYELLIPENIQNKAENHVLQRIAGIIKSKKTLLRQKTGDIIDELLLEIIKNFNE